MKSMLMILILLSCINFGQAIHCRYKMNRKYNSMDCLSACCLFHTSNETTTTSDENLTTERTHELDDDSGYFYFLVLLVILPILFIVYIINKCKRSRHQHRIPNSITNESFLTAVESFRKVPQFQSYNQIIVFFISIKIKKKSSQMLFI